MLSYEVSLGRAAGRKERVRVMGNRVWEGVREIYEMVGELVYVDRWTGEWYV